MSSCANQSSGKLNTLWMITLINMFAVVNWQFLSEINWVGDLKSFENERSIKCCNLIYANECGLGFFFRRGCKTNAIFLKCAFAWADCLSEGEHVREKERRYNDTDPTLQLRSAQNQTLHTWRLCSDDVDIVLYYYAYVMTSHPNQSVA